MPTILKRPTLEISSVTELTKLIRDLFNSTNSRWWFRGHQRASYTLLPKVRREYDTETERYLFYYFYPRAQMRHAKCPADDDLAGWLALMQHYGLPTRLLDWTWSPLVAAFFATQDAKSEGSQDACIWALEPSGLNENQGYEPLFPPLNAEMVRPLLKPARYGKAKEPNTILASMPVETDLRMLVQQGAFTVHSSPKELNRLPDSDSWLRQIMIPNQGKRNIATELNVLSVRKADLFPDLENLSKEAIEVYRPAPSSPRAGR